MYRNYFERCNLNLQYILYYDLYFDLYEEKNKFYDETKLLFQEQYTIKQIDTCGLVIGSRGTIPNIQ